MSNFIDSSKWLLTNTVKNNETFTVTSGKMVQTITLPTNQLKYFLKYNCTSLSDHKSYFLFKVTTLGGKHTYLIPIMFIGENTIDLALAQDVRTVEVSVVGSLVISDIQLVEDAALTESQKDAITKVETESDKWDRINDVTNAQGNLIANRLEGSINNALNSIFGGNGTMEIIDGTILFRDKATDALSTMAMRINFGGLAIADSKKADGTWNWKTFGTGQGFTADYMTTGTLSAITIDGVTITATDIIGGKITGAVFDGGTTQAGTINGCVIRGSTIIGGNEGGIHTRIDPTNPFRILRGASGALAEIWGYVDGGAYMKLNWTDASNVTRDKLTLRSGNIQSYLEAEDTQLNISASGAGSGAGYQIGRIQLNSENGVYLRVKTYDLIKAESDYNLSMGRTGYYTNIKGYTTIPDLSTMLLSELEIENMELKQQLNQQAVEHSELEVKLMERGVL